MEHYFFGLAGGLFVANLIEDRSLRLVIGLIVLIGTLIYECVSKLK